MNFAFLRRLLPQSLSWPRLRSSSRASVGRRGEQAAVRYLKRTGHRVLARNYQCAAGEIDLIAADGDTIVFVEVKSRTDSPALDQPPATPGLRGQCPQFSVRHPQRDRIGRAARYFLSQTRSFNRPCRFDIMTVAWPDRGRPVVEHFKSAFQPRGT